MDKDIYWSHVCINALKQQEYKLFSYGYQFIEESSRKKKLNELYDKIKDGDEEIKNLLLSYKCPIITHIS